MAISVKDRPLISIGVPVYNEEQYLSQALDSLLTQDYENFEVIISDNDSSDATPLICAEYEARDRRIRYYRNESNCGGIRNFNRVFELANGEFFVWASGHDLRGSSFLSRCVEPLLEDEAVVLCHSRVAWVDADRNVLETIPSQVDTRGIGQRTLRLNVVLWGLSTGFPIYGVIRSSALRQTRMYRQVVSPDVTLLVELSLIGTFAHVPELLLFARRPKHENTDEYLAMHFEKNFSRWSAQTLYWRMIGELCKGVTTHVSSYAGKAIGILSTLICMLTKWRVFLRALRS